MIPVQHCHVRMEAVVLRYWPIQVLTGQRIVASVHRASTDNIVIQVRKKSLTEVLLTEMNLCRNQFLFNHGLSNV